jgi:hypothetical protein
LPLAKNLQSLRSASFMPSPSGTATQVKQMLGGRRYRGAKGNNLITIRESIKGQILSVCPIYGYGWTNFINTIEPPRNFKISVTNTKHKLFKIIGFSGLIVDTDHIYYNYYIEAVLRHKGQYNFSNQIGDYNILISDKPIQNFSFRKKVNQKYICGYGFIGEEGCVADFANELFHK